MAKDRTLAMQFILLLSAIVAALSGAVSGRVVVPHQVESASSVGVEALAAEPAITVVAIAAVLFGIAARILPMCRAFAFRRTIAIYQERRRE